MDVHTRLMKMSDDRAAAAESQCRRLESDLSVARHEAASLRDELTAVRATASAQAGSGGNAAAVLRMLDGCISDVAGLLNTPSIQRAMLDDRPGRGAKDAERELQRAAREYEKRLKQPDGATQKPRQARTPPSVSPKPPPSVSPKPPRRVISSPASTSSPPSVRRAQSHESPRAARSPVRDALKRVATPERSTPETERRPTPQKLKSGFLRQFDKGIPVGGGIPGGNPGDVLKAVRKQRHADDDGAEPATGMPAPPRRRADSDDEPADDDDWSSSDNEGGAKEPAATSSSLRPDAAATPVKEPAEVAQPSPESAAPPPVSPSKKPPPAVKPKPKPKPKAGAAAPASDAAADAPAEASTSVPVVTVQDDLIGTRVHRAPSLTAQFARPKIQKKRLPSRRGRQNKQGEEEEGEEGEEEEGEGRDGHGADTNDTPAAPPAEPQAEPQPEPQPAEQPAGSKSLLTDDDDDDLDALFAKSRQIKAKARAKLTMFLDDDEN